MNSATGEAFLLPPDQIRRVILCCGQIYYHLSRARRARRIRDTVLVRLEQITPFPSDLLFKARNDAPSNSAVWVLGSPTSREGTRISRSRGAGMLLLAFNNAFA